MRYWAVVLATTLISCQGNNPQPKTKAQDNPPGGVATSSPSKRENSTELLAHHVSLVESGGLTLKIGWLRARMYPTRVGVNPSFDDPNSFVVDIQDGYIGISLQNLAKLLASGALKDSSLSGLKLSAEGQRIKLNATWHKIMPLPVEMIGDLGITPEGKVKVHVEKLDVLKIPVKGLLKTLHVDPADLVGANKAKGLQVNGNEIYLDVKELLPPPHNIGKVTQARIGNEGDLVLEYGSAKEDAIKVKEWHNFFRLRGGTIDFGALTMHGTDLFLIDTSDDDWFEFDLARYEEQLVNGYAHITATSGLQIFMPNISKIPRTKANERISLEWIKNRSEPAPAEVR